MEFLIKNKSRAFFSLSVCIFSFVLLFLSLIEYEMLHAVFACSMMEEAYHSKLEKGQLLDNILNFERKKIEIFLKQHPEKTIFDYVMRTTKGELLMKLEKGKSSEGGYFIEADLPKRIERNFYKIYYVKYYKIAEYNHKYKIQVLIDYKYAESKEIYNFISQKLIEIRVYLE